MAIKMKAGKKSIAQHVMQYRDDELSYIICVLALGRW